MSADIVSIQDLWDETRLSPALLARRKLARDLRGKDIHPDALADVVEFPPPTSVEEDA